MKVLVLIALVLFASSISADDEYHPRKKSSPKSKLADVAPKAPVVNVMEASRTFWRNKAATFIQSKLRSEPTIATAKNVIFFIGDGMGPSTVAAARMYAGKEELALAFENFPHYGLAKTYCVDAQVGNERRLFTAVKSPVCFP